MCQYDLYYKNAELSPVKLVASVITAVASDGCICILTTRNKHICNADVLSTGTSQQGICKPNALLVVTWWTNYSGLKRLHFNSVHANIFQYLCMHPQKLCCLCPEQFWSIPERKHFRRLRFPVWPVFSYADLESEARILFYVLSKLDLFIIIVLVGHSALILEKLQLNAL